MVRTMLGSDFPDDPAHCVFDGAHWAGLEMS
jgi:hypothetical protein